MKLSRLSVQTIALGIVGLLVMAQAEAQTIYKCGSNYSDTPCTQGAAVPTADPRSPAQKAQTDQATVNAKALGGQLEKVRLASEAAADRRAQSQAKAMALAVKSTQKAQAEAKRVEAKAKGKQPKTKVVKLGKTSTSASGKKKATSAVGKPPAPEGKTTSKTKLAP